jgi:UDP-N-acetylmuramoyl-tripeptide--D-alanyl-D-alanine ligase
MKTFFKARFADLLAYLAHEVVGKYKPKVIMVTGSVGKTSTKDAVAATLGSRYHLRASEKSFNSEYGVPFTIFGVKNPWKSVAAWLGALKSAFALLLLPNHYPNLLVLEVGADRPGDLAKILRITAPSVVVLTRLPEVPVHVEAYATPEAVREEEFSPAYALSPGAPLIVPADDPFAVEMAKRVPVRCTTYGEHKNADVRLTEIEFYAEAGKVVGMRAHLSTEAGAGEIVVKGSVGRTQLLPAAAAVATALALGATLPEALAALEAYEPPPGRGRIFAGKSDTTLIDDTYNASPAAVEEALATLKAFPMQAGKKGRKIAILGDMLELGRYSVAEHERIGLLAAHSAEVVISIGVRARALAESARTIHHASCAFSYDNSEEAARALVDYVEPGDVILVKGSQSVRTERIMEALVSDPADRAGLVRQEEEWSRR